MKQLLIAVGILIMTGPLLAQSKEETKSLGSELTLSEVTAVSVLLETPEEFVGREILIEGKVADVCPKMGCWMDIENKDGSETFQVKVKDGEIVFPVSAKGKMARVQGVVEAIEMTQEDAVAFYQHKADEKGEEFDPATVTGPMKYYRLKGKGAVIR